jgi:glycosyltransferase involved in cell wall biosynthesis
MATYITKLESNVTSDDGHNTTVRDPAAACRSVLMVGTDPDGMGGVRAVVRGYLDGGLFERYRCVYVATHRAGSAWVKTTTALKAWLKVAVYLRKLDAPLVHVQTASRASFWRKSVVCLMARWAGRPYLLHVHGGEFMQFYEEESGPLAQRFIRSIFAHAALVIALSDEWGKRLLRVCPTATVEVLHNAVALPDTAGLPRLADRDPTLLFLGNLGRGKGTYDLVRAFALVAARFPRLKLVCGGVGCVEEVRQLATQLEIRDRVLCPGWLNPERKSAELASGTIFILPSYAEGMPMALLEAMSWRLPVIATPVGGIPQVVRNEVNGLLVAPGDIDGLAAAITRLMKDPALRERFGAAARATIEAGFSLEEALEHLSTIYRRFGIEARAGARAAARADGEIA